MRKHRKSITKVLLATMVLTAIMSFTSWAGEWKNPPDNAIEIVFEANPDCLEFVPFSALWKCKINGEYVKNRWVHFDFGSYDKWKYFDKDGLSLRNAQTPDGYPIDNDGDWVRPATGEYVYDEVIEIDGNSFTMNFDNTKNTILRDQASRICFKLNESAPLYGTTTINGTTVSVVDESVTTIQFCSEHSNVDPNMASVLIWPAVTNTNNDISIAWWILQEPTAQPLEYDKDYSIGEFLQMAGKDGTVVIEVVDKNMNGAGVEKNGLQIKLSLQTENFSPVTDVKNGNDCLHHNYNILK